MVPHWELMLWVAVCGVEVDGVDPDRGYGWVLGHGRRRPEVAGVEQPDPGLGLDHEHRRTRALFVACSRRRCS